MSNRPQPKKSTRSGGRTVAASRKQATSNRTSWIIVAVVLVLGLAAVVAIAATRGGTKTNTAGTVVVSDPATLVSTIAGVSGDTITTVGNGGVKALPKPIAGSDLTADGKPLVLYVGAEFCPFCAAERWAMVQSLSRFGTFSNLTFTHSSPTDTFPNTPTLTFHGATYQSSVVSFQGVEVQAVDRQPLDTLTDAQNAVFSNPAYNPAQSFPWINFGGQFVISGASYSPGVLAGKSADEVTAVLSDPSSAITKGVVGTANIMTATICILTGDQPSSACSSQTIQDLETQIKAQS